MTVYIKYKNLLVVSGGQHLITKPCLFAKNKSRVCQNFRHVNILMEAIYMCLPYSCI